MRDFLSYKWIDSKILDVDFRLEWVIDETKKLLSLLNNIEALIWNLDIPKNLNDFVEFRKNIFFDIDLLFSNELEWETDNFKLAFWGSDVNFLLWDELKKIQLEELILKKQKIYNLYLLEALKSWTLDELFSVPERNTIRSLIESRIFDYFNELLLVWQDDLYEWKNWEYVHPENTGLVYWWMKNWKIVPYREKLDPNISYSNFLNTSDENIKAYLVSVWLLISSWEMDYDKWLEIENLAINTWESETSKLALNTPIETYEKENVLVDPELELFIRDADDNTRDTASNLSNKYFWQDYDIWAIKFSIVEPILSAWVVWFKNVLWKSFPNSPKLTEERGTFIYSIKSKLGDIWKSQVFIDSLWLTDINEDEFKKMSIEHVAIHEYGHSLFIKWNKNTVLEETKASLFYLLKINDDNCESEFDENYIEDFVKFSLIEIARKVKNKDVPAYKQYVIREKFILESLLVNWLVHFDNAWKATINPNKESFINYLEDQKKLLFTIQEIYFDSIEGKEKEEILLNDLEFFVSDEIETIFNNIIKN